MSALRAAVGRRRRKPARDTVAFDALHRIVDSGKVSPDEVFGVLSRHGYDVDGVVRLAELVAQVQADKFPDLSDRRRARIAEFGRGVFVLGVAVALEAETAR